VFSADKPGAYKLRVLGCANDGRVKSLTAQIQGYAVDVPCVLAESEAGVVTGTPRLIDSAGDSPRVVGPEFAQVVPSEAEWVASLFEREIAARTDVAHGRLAYPSGPSQISMALGEGIAPVLYEASLSVFAPRFVWLGPTDTGFATRLYRAHINSTPEFPPQLLSTLPGRNTGPHYVGPEGQIVWTRTLYEPETEGGRPRSSEIWRMNADGKNPVRLIAYPSTPTRAVLVTTGMGN
jgi:hypothetical protein